MLLHAASLFGAPIAHIRGAVGLSAMIALSAAALPILASGVASMHSGNQQAGTRLAAIAPPLLLREVDREDALGINSDIPFSDEPNPAARPFEIRGDHAAYNRALQCLTEAIYYEADGELPDGQRAVAQVVLNRVRHPAFSQGVCAAVYHGSLRITGCQFSFTCNGSMRRRPAASGWTKARRIAEQALAGAVFKPVGFATHYHADYVVPYWATSLAKNAVIGTHIFYRWPGWWGQPSAFAQHHPGQEVDPRLLRNAALRRHGIRPEPPSWSAEDLALEADPRVELISIIQFLAARSPHSDNATPYEKEVRRHFSGYSDHVAIEIYRQLSARNSKFNVPASLRTLMHYTQPPKLESRGPLERELVSAAGGKQKLDGFISALRDFARHSDFETFMKEQKPLYAELGFRAREPTLAMVAAVEQDTGVPVHAVRFILAPLLTNSASAGCQTVRDQDSGAWVIVGLASSSGKRFDKPALLKEALANLSESECLSPARAVVADHEVRLPRNS